MFLQFTTTSTFILQKRVEH